MTTTPRPWSARIGLALLNVLVPGIGLWRLGRWNWAIGLYFASLLAFATTDFVHFSALWQLFAIVAISLLALLAAIILTLAWSRQRASVPTGSRWPVVIPLGIAAIAVSFVVTSHPRYRSFFLPAQSMLPTFAIHDRFFAEMGSFPLRRGELVLVKRPDGTIYVKRIAALAGYRFAMRKGVVVLNGITISQRQVATDEVADNGMKIPARRLSEQLPGEARSHLIYDLGEGPFDDVEEVEIAPHHVFVLGDNRDRSADSRVPVDLEGLGQVDQSSIVGVPRFLGWGSSQPLGTRLDD